MFSVAKKSFEEYLFGFTFVLLYFRWGILAEIISGFAKTGVVFSDTSLSVPRLVLLLLFAHLLWVLCCVFLSGLVLPAEVLFVWKRRFLADCFLYGCNDFIRLLPPVHCPNAADVPTECFQYIVLDNLTVACGFRTFVVLSVTDDT